MVFQDRYALPRAGANSHVLYEPFRNESLRKHNPPSLLCSQEGCYNIRRLACLAVEETELRELIRLPNVASRAAPHMK